MENTELKWEEELVEEYADKVTTYGYNDEYGYYQDWKDGVRPILQEFRIAVIAKAYAQGEQDMLERTRKALRGSRENCMCHEKNQAQFDLLAQGKL